MYTEDIKKLKNIIGVAKSDKMDASLMYIDSDPSLGTKTRTNKIKLSEFNGVGLYKTLSNKIINFIDTLCEQHSTDIKDKFSLNMNNITESYNDEGAIRSIIATQVKNMSNYIAINGRIGKAHWVAIPKDFYENYISDVENRDYIFEKVECDLFGDINVLIDSRIEHIYLGRINEMEQPSLLLVYNNDKSFNYGLTQIGFFPYKQYFRIKFE